MSWLISIGIVILILLLLGAWAQLEENHPDTMATVHMLAAIGFIVWIIHTLIIHL